MRPAKVEEKNGERFLTEVNPYEVFIGGELRISSLTVDDYEDFEEIKESIFTDDTTLIVGDVYDLDDFRFDWQFKDDFGVWVVAMNGIEGCPFETRQVARKKAVAETPVIDPEILRQIEVELTASKKKGVFKDVQMGGIDVEGKEPEAMTSAQIRWLCEYCKTPFPTNEQAFQCCECLRVEDEAEEYSILHDQIEHERSLSLHKFSDKEVAIISSLLNVASSGWFVKDALPKGIKTQKEAEKIVGQLSDLFTKK